MNRSLLINTLGSLSILSVVGCQTIVATVSSGTIDYDTDGSTLDGDSDVQLLNARFENKDGSSIRGMEGEYWKADDDLLSETSVGGSDFDAFEVTAYLGRTINLRRGWRSPIRVGATYHDLTVDFDTPSTTSRWKTLGIKGSISPEIDLIRGEKGRISVFGTASYVFGITDVETDTAESGSFDGSSSLLGLEAGIKYQRGDLGLGVGYLIRRLTIDDVDDDDTGLPILGVEHELNAWFARAQLRF